MPRLLRTALLAACLAAPAAADRLAVPIVCPPAMRCVIQHFVDLDPGPGIRDFTGGDQAYDGHNGTDFRVPDLEAMAGGIPVLAPAAGRVTGARDGEVDRIIVDRSEVAGVECGNGVRLDHGDGLVTQLCHLERGSIAVRPGDTVVRGQTVGRIGLSGATQFPHVHMRVERDGIVVDPFREALWIDPPDYRPGGLLSAGFIDAIPEFDAVKAGTADAAVLPVDAPALVLWGAAWGARAGDVIRLRALGPSGQEVFAHEAAIERDQAQLFRAAGRPLRAARWRGGAYAGEVTLLRDGQVIDRIETGVMLD